MPQTGFGDGQQFSDGVRGQKGTRNAPTVFNSAYYTTQFWDGRAPSLEKQAEGADGESHGNGPHAGGRGTKAEC